MKTARILLAAGLLLSAAQCSDVITLTPISFNTVIGISTHPSVVNFYSGKNCDKCDKLAAEFEKVGEYFRDDDVNIAKFDCGRLKGFCSFYGISEYPTIKYFDSADRRGIAYAGDLKAAALINYIEEKVAAAPPPEDSESSMDTQNLVGHMAGPDEIPVRGAPGHKEEEEEVIVDNADNVEVKREEVVSVEGEEMLVEKPSGRVQELDKIAEVFVKSENKEELIEEAKKSEEKNAKYYVKYMELIVKNGAEFVEQEKERLEKTIAEGTSPRLDEFIVRRNIIQAF